eukprot:scaffold448415_cov18-Prasinocladus_malaysianus.AAC.1
MSGRYQDDRVQEQDSRFGALEARLSGVQPTVDTDSLTPTAEINALHGQNTLRRKILRLRSRRRSFCLAKDTDWHR